MYGLGISKVGDLLDLGTDVGIIDKSGSWYSYRGDRLGQGREQSSNFIRSNPEVMKDIEERIRLHFGLVPEVTDEASPAEPGNAPTKAESAAKPRKSNGRRNSRSSAN